MAAMHADHESFQPETPMPATVPVGAPIYSRDDRRLGVVKEVTEHCFLVDARLAFDYWLSTRCVAAVTEGSVRLGVDKRDLGDYLVDMDCPEDFEDLEPVSANEEALGLSPAGS